MGNKWTIRIAIFCILSILGILISAFLPGSKSSESIDKEVVTAETATTSQEADTDVNIQHNAAAGEQRAVNKEEIRQPESESPQSDGQTAVFSHKYYYNSLDAVQKALYMQIYESITTREDAVLDTLDDSVVDKLFQCVVNDYPEIFYCAAYKLEKQMRGAETVRLTFKPQFHMTVEEEQMNMQLIDEAVRQCVSNVPAGADEYGKVKYVYEYVIQNTEYVPNSANNQNICSVFIGHESVCQGYAKAAQYLLNRIGIEATLAYGKVENEFHSWNLVRVDGDYYYMDPTWGDAGYVRPQQTQSVTSQQSVNYEYFLITTAQISRTHVIDNVVPLPACISARNNYYIREGLYLTSYDEEVLQSIFDLSDNQSAGYITFMCADDFLYRQVKEQLISGQKIFDYMNTSNSVSYSYNDDMYTLIFWIE